MPGGLQNTFGEGDRELSSVTLTTQAPSLGDCRCQKCNPEPPSGGQSEGAGWGGGGTGEADGLEAYIGNKGPRIMSTGKR